jgi:hypothetical protein
MSDDDSKNEKLGVAMMLRALENGAGAVQYIAAINPSYLERSLETCAVVFAMWPDPKAESCIGILPIKRNARNGVEQGQDVIPCASREMAGALLEKFGDAKLKAEFADYLRPLN